MFEHPNELYYVDWTKFTPYYDPETITHTHNVWEYYFKQPSIKNYPPAEQIIDVGIWNGHSSGYCNLCDITPERKLTYHNIITKNLILLPYLKNKIEQFETLHDLKNKNILDFGCGIGSFYKFLKKKKIPIKKYYAIEINPLLKNFIKKKFKNKINLIDNNFKNKKIDITISNGVHNFKIKKISNIFFQDLNFLIKVTKYVIGISFINNNIDYKENYLSYKNMNKVIKFIQKKKLNFIIDQTLNKYETFLFIIK
jgi:SAM-dependent methyltransferase